MICKTLKDNVTSASDLTLNVIPKNIYMDKFIFAMDSLATAESIVNESFALFKSRGFDLIKWSANGEALSVLAKLNVNSLASSFRDLNRKDDFLENYLVRRFLVASGKLVLIV